MPTAIEWCDETFNPWWGCEKVSPGCAHCYAEGLANHRAHGEQLWGDGHGFKFFGDKHWNQPLVWARNLPVKLGRRPRVFCASMADVFEERDELEEPRERLFALIADTPELDWLILTKRPEFARDWLKKRETGISPNGMTGYILTSRCRAFDGPLPNVWMGVSIENARHTYRADVLREIPAAVRFISAEPLLGSLYDGRSDDDAVRLPVLQAGRRGDGGLPHAGIGRGDPAVALDRAAPDPLAPQPEVPEGDAHVAHRRAPLDLTSIDWVIVGGESGPGARPMHLEWAREIVRECMNHSVAPFVKQLGSKPTSAPLELLIEGGLRLRDKKGGDWSEWPADLRIREFPASAAVLA